VAARPVATRSGLRTAGTCWMPSGDPISERVRTRERRRSLIPEGSPNEMTVRKGHKKTTEIPQIGPRCVDMIRVTTTTEESVAVKKPKRAIRAKGISMLSTIPLQLGRGVITKAPGVGCDVAVQVPDPKDVTKWDDLAFTSMGPKLLSVGLVAGVVL